jgi:hypothetical protein
VDVGDGIAGQVLLVEGTSRIQQVIIARQALGKVARA